MPETIEHPVDETSGSGAGMATADPFSLDENSLISLSPEQRAGLDPIIDTWKKRANEEIQKREAASSDRYKPYEEKAKALDKLTQFQPFVQWWGDQQRQASQGATSSQRQAISKTQPEDIVSPSEWQEAVLEASNGDGSKLRDIQSKMMTAWATPFVQEITQKQQAMATQFELKEMFENHPDAKDLDSIGVDPKTKEGVSLLEIGLEWAEKNGKSLEDGYKLARGWADSMKVTAQQQAMGMVKDKKQEMTEGPSVSSSNQNIVMVDSADELIRRSLDAQFSGNKDVRFVIKGR